MSGVAGVVTTGIYCRAGCSASPLPGNVRRFDFAAAAEAAGYRACLRCRPYRTNVHVTIDGPEVVCRAIHLILDGALDDHREDHLAARLAMSARHLRRLFHAHVGATPNQLARSSRAHFARRLLDDTDLSVTDIAFASGFSSLRQFNRTMLGVFRAAPLALRARRRKSDRLVADGGLVLRLGHAAALDRSSMVAYLGARAVPGVEYVDACVYRRTLVVDGDLGALEISPGGPGYLELRMHLPHWRGLMHLVQRARRIFNLDGAGTAGTWDPFEVGVCAIIGQNAALADARAIAARMVERHGERAPGLGAMCVAHTFPPPVRLVDADLSGIGLTAVQVSAIHAFAGMVTSGGIRLDSGASGDELNRAVAAVPELDGGFVQDLAVRMGVADAIPADDADLRRPRQGLPRCRGGAA